MRVERAAVGLLLLAVLLAPPAPAAPPSGRQRAADADLPAAYRKWLDEEVVYIVTPTEREVFRKLRTDRERDLFIEAFWRQRDPTPASAENEFKTEHFRRIAYADRYLGRDAPRPGWRTDRGRYYIILGEPRDIRRFEGKSQTYDAEVWFYQGLSDVGLPAAFHLVFFREGGSGEYRLYSPVADGPQALLSGYFGGPDTAAAYARLREIEPDLAAVSLSLVPGDDGSIAGRPSLSSDLLIQRVEASPGRAVEPEYARKFLLYKDVVEVEYTANWLDSDALVKVFRDESGLAFVHYAIEPKRLSVQEYGGKYATTLRVNGRVTAPDGRLVHQYDKTVSLDLTEDQVRAASASPFDFQDLFPLVPGDYEFSVLVKNEASKEFTSIERTLRVPAAGATVELLQPLLGYRAVRLEPGQRRTKAFRVGPYQITCQPGRTFSRRDTLAVAFQLNGLSPELAAEGEISVAFLKDGQVFRERERRPADCPDLPVVVEEFPLADFPAAHYAVRVAFSRAGVEIVSATEEFDLSFAEALPRPWFSSRILPDAADPVYPEIVGAQLFNLGRYAEARTFLERAAAGKPGSEDTAASLARAHLALDDPAAAAKVLVPFAGAERTAKYETFVLLADALRWKGDLAEAVELLERAVSLYGVNAALLNAVGECQQGLGRIKEALEAFERSLELSPDQPEVRKKVEELKRKKAG